MKLLLIQKKIFQKAGNQVLSVTQNIAMESHKSVFESLLSAKDLVQGFVSWKISSLQ